MTEQMIAEDTPEVVESEESLLSLNVSESLRKKLVEKASEEGVSAEDLAKELLAEGLVLRAFEIAERKQAMRGQHSGNSNFNSGGNRSHRNNRSNSGNNNSNRRSSGGNRRNNYRQILDDSATFLEYVRAQEKSKKKR